MEYTQEKKHFFKKSPKPGGVTWDRYAQLFNEKFNCCKSGDTIRKAYKKFTEKQVAGNDVSSKTNEWVESEVSATGTATTAIKPDSMEDACKLFNVNTKKWKPIKMKINQWDVSAKDSQCNFITKTNYQVTVWFGLRGDEIDVEEMIETFKKEVASYSPPPIVIYKKFKGNKDTLLEVTNFDLHLGKLCWHRETGENYDIKIASRRYDDGINDLVNKALSFGFGKIVFAVGNDFFQADTIENQTSAGTTVDTDVRWQKRFNMGCRLLVNGISKLRRFSEVDVYCIPGNHDWMTMYMAGEYLKAWFRKEKGVIIHNSPMSRQYHRWEDVLIGYTHGHKEKPADLFMEMANSNSDIWGEISTREWHCGHFHHEKTKDFKGVVVRWLMSQTGTDSWHFGKGFTGSMKGCQAFMYQKGEGLISTFYSRISLKK